MPLLEWIMAEAPAVKVRTLKDKRNREKRKRTEVRSKPVRAMNPRRR